MKPALALAIALMVAGCTTENITNVYVADSAAAPDASLPIDSSTMLDSFTPQPDSGSPEETTDSMVDAVADTPHVRCQVESGIVFEGCNGKYPAQSARIYWQSAGDGSGLCPAESEEAGSPPGNCIPDFCTDAGTCVEGYCTVSAGLVPTTLWGKCI